MRQCCAYTLIIDQMMMSRHLINEAMIIELMKVEKGAQVFSGGLRHGAFIALEMIPEYP